MKVVEATAEDKATLKKIVETTVIPGWVKRCGARCGEIYNEVVAPITGVKFTGELTSLLSSQAGAGIGSMAKRCGAERVTSRMTAIHAMRGTEFPRRTTQSRELRSRRS